MIEFRMRRPHNRISTRPEAETEIDIVEGDGKVVLI
jgi:hypothetical protein